MNEYEHCIKCLLVDDCECEPEEVMDYIADIINDYEAGLLAPPGTFFDWSTGKNK